MDNGPTKRKSPYRHKVKDHIRANKLIYNYERGKGDKAKASARRSRSRVVGGDTNPVGTPYDVIIYYTDYTSERISVDAEDYHSAITGGLEQRDAVESPKIVRMRRSR